MKHLLIFCALLVALCIASPAQSWDIYNSPGDGGEIDFSNITSAMGITFDATDNMDIDASTTTHTSIDGVIDITLTPSAPSTKGTQITIDTNGQNDTMAHNVTYTANGMEVGDIGMAMEININPGTSTGGEVEGLRITRTGINGIEVHALHAGTSVAPIQQNSGTPVMMDIAFLYNSSIFINATTAFQNDSSPLNYTLVPNTNDYIYIGHATTFSEVEIILATNADTSIVPVFEYYTGGWTVFGPNDSTAGLTTDGSWAWDTLADWSTTTINGVASKYWIRVQRTAAVTTDAVEKTIDIIIPAEYSWDSDGIITAYKFIGGDRNTAGGMSAGSPAGSDNEAEGTAGFIGGGTGNIISSFDPHVFIGAGSSNNSSAARSFIGAGNSNTIGNNGGSGFLGAGANNLLNSIGGSVIVAGSNNTNYGDYSFIGAGRYARINSTADRSFADIYGTSTIAINDSDVHVIYGEAGFEKKVGIQNLAPDDTLDVAGSTELNGSVALSGFTSISTDYTVDTDIFFIECDATLGNISTTLPPIAAKKGRLLEIKLLSASNGCYLDGNGAETIDGAAGYAITAQYDSVSIIAGSSGWLIDEILAANVYAQLSDSSDQTFAGTGTPQSITLNTNDEIAGITHSTTVNPENVTIVTDGVYTIIAQPQVAAGAGAAGYFHMWLQVDTGGGFADVPNSNIELVLASNDQDVIPFIAVISLDKDDIVRLRSSVGDTGIKLDAQAPAGEPAIPAIIYSIYKI